MREDIVQPTDKFPPPKSIALLLTMVKNVISQHFMKIRHIGAVCKVISEYIIVSRRNIFKTTDGSFFSYFKYIFKFCAFK